MRNPAVCKWREGEGEKKDNGNEKVSEVALVKLMGIMARNAISRSFQY